MTLTWVSSGSPPVPLLSALKTSSTPWDFKTDIYGYGLHVGCGLPAVKDLHSTPDVHEFKSCGWIWGGECLTEEGA